jgi:hypothetical protein
LFSIESLLFFCVLNLYLFKPWRKTQWRKRISAVSTPF